MSKRILHFLLMLLVGVIGCIFYYLFCSSCYQGTTGNSLVKDTLPATTSIKPKTPVPTSNAFALSDPGTNFNLSINEHFNFNANNFDILKPLSPKVDIGIEKLKAYLDKHHEKTLDIVGLYTSKEKNTSAYPNLGVGRATAVKNYLVSKGISSKQLNALGKLDDSLVPQGTIYQGPVAYHFNTSKSEADEDAKREAELKALHEDIISDPLKLNFETNSSDLALTSTQRSKMAKLSRYLDKADNGQIIVTGHTDSTGDANANIQLGLSRAETIKSYLISNGIDATKIGTLSKGAKEPIASNATAEGRKQNRRVEVTLK